MESKIIIRVRPWRKLPLTSTIPDANLYSISFKTSLLLLRFPVLISFEIKVFSLVNLFVSYCQFVYPKLKFSFLDNNNNDFLQK